MSTASPTAGKRLKDIMTRSHLDIGSRRFGGGGWAFPSIADRSKRLAYWITAVACAVALNAIVGGTTASAADDALVTGTPRNGGWQLTVYYTAVEAFHFAPLTNVTGCLTITCSHGNADLGSYPADFVQAVMDEGTGRITSSASGHAGKYLNWTITDGGGLYWLDTAPRDSTGGVLIPYQSAAADPAVSYGSIFQIWDCGVDDTIGVAIDTPTCAALMGRTWVVRDRFSIGSVGKHLDLYIGEEDAPNFIYQSSKVISTSGAVTTIAVLH